jgi:hypothetical protein
VGIATSESRLDVLIRSLSTLPRLARDDVARRPYGAVETAPIDERDIAAVTVRVLSEGSLAGGDDVLTVAKKKEPARPVVGYLLDIEGARTLVGELGVRRSSAPSNLSGVGAAASFTAHCQPSTADGGAPSKDAGIGPPAATNLVGCFRS